jgi:hypothetical protein
LTEKGAREKAITLLKEWVHPRIVIDDRFEKLGGTDTGPKVLYGTAARENGDLRWLVTVSEVIVKKDTREHPTAPPTQ